MAELALFAYPWDIASDGPERLVDALADLGVDRIEVATAYHSLETIRPRRLSQVHVLPEGNVAHLPIDLSSFGELVPPLGELATQQPRLIERLASSAAAASISLTGWTIMLHNSFQAARVPDAALENCFGDRSGHGLCPTNPSVERYARELALAVARTGYFDELLLESLSFLLAGHGHPHQLWAVSLDLHCRLLLSLCFCEHCTKRAEALGIDAAALRARVRRELDRLWNEPPVRLSPEEEAAALEEAVYSDPELRAWVSLRADIVTRLARAIVADLAAINISTVLSAAIWARDVRINWLEGIDLGTQGQLSGVALLPYHLDPAVVKRELDAATALIPAARLQLVQTLSHAHQDGRDDLAAKIRIGQDAGVERFALYNYGMATTTQLGWVADVARQVHAPD